jgi:gliding motility-associated-like protein
MRYFFTLLALTIISAHSKAQYSVNGSAVQNTCRCYTLTPNILTQFGAVWNNNKINLNQSFDFTFQVFLGCTDGNGADGIAFVLQKTSTTIGTTGTGGGSMGYLGINPAVGVTLDTYQNTSPDNDPFYDHIAIQLNGNTNHLSANTITPPTPISATNNNVEDCLNHNLRVVWNATTKNMIVYFDAQQRLSVTNDFVNTVFAGDSLVYWGFTGATGGLSNEQKFCTILTPSFHFAPNQKKCVFEPITFYDSTTSFAGVTKRYWNFGDGSPIDSVNINPVHIYTTPGQYNVILRVKGLDGCEETITQIVNIGAKPNAGFSYTSNCATLTVQFTDTSRITPGTINSWYWNFSSISQTSTQQSPSVVCTAPGPLNVQFVVTSSQGCSSDTLNTVINVAALPTVSFSALNAVCATTPTFALSGGSPVTATGFGTGVYSGIGVTSATGIFNPSVAGVGTHTITYTYTEVGGCSSSATQTITVNASQNASINPVAALCLNDNNLVLSANPSGGVFSGNGTDATGNFNPTAAGVGTQTITYSVPSDPCVIDGTISIVVNPIPSNVSAGPSFSIVVGGGVNLQASGSANNYTWTPSIGLSNPNILSPFANPQQTTVYKLTAENSFGCSYSDTMVVTVNAPCLDPAKIFTPNNDGLYDKWVVFNSNCISKVEANVYNRWGGLVYHSDDYRNTWDGTYKNKPLPDATYYYVLNIVDNNGIKYTKKGSVTIMR